MKSEQIKTYSKNDLESKNFSYINSEGVYELWGHEDQRILVFRQNQAFTVMRQYSIKDKLPGTATP